MQPPIIKSKYSPGVYFVKDQEWKVGPILQIVPQMLNSMGITCSAIPIFQVFPYATVDGYG